MAKSGLALVQPVLNLQALIPENYCSHIFTAFGRHEMNSQQGSHGHLTVHIFNL